MPIAMWPAPAHPCQPADTASVRWNWAQRSTEGPIWIGIEPQFQTGRGHLGIHLDPSANRNHNSGTLGCVGLIHRDDMLQLADLIRRRNVRSLVVSD